MFTINHSFTPSIELDVEFLDMYETLFDAATKCGIETRGEGLGIEIVIDFDNSTITSFYLNEHFKEFFLSNEREVIRSVLMHQVWLHLKGRNTTSKEYDAMVAYGWPERWIEENLTFLEQYFD